jgi:NAD dependent epimerase/dehydratase family enzyme
MLQTVQSEGVRVVCLRTGVVLDPKGGALAKLLPIFRLGAGGSLGNGQQYFRYLNLVFKAILLIAIQRVSVTHRTCSGCCGSLQYYLLHERSDQLILKVTVDWC